MQYDWCIYKKGNFEHRDTYTRRMPCEDEGRDQGDASVSQKMPKTANRPPVARKEEQMFFFPHGSKKELTMKTPWSWTSSLQNWDNKFLLFKATHFVVPCYHSLSKLIHHLSSFISDHFFLTLYAPATPTSLYFLCIDLMFPTFVLLPMLFFCLKYPFWSR